MVASSRMPKPRPVASVLRSVPGPDASAANARNKISAALVTSRPVRPTPSMTAASVELARVVLLPDARQDEHLVVHRQPEQEREDHQRDPERHRAGRGDAEDRVRSRGRPARTAPSTPSVAPSEIRFSTTAFNGSSSDRNARTSSRYVRTAMISQHQREVAVDRVQEVDLRRADAGHADHAGQPVHRGLDPFDDADALRVHRFRRPGRDDDGLPVAVAARVGGDRTHA